MDCTFLQRTAIGAAPGAEGSLTIFFFSSAMKMLSGSRRSLDPFGGLVIFFIGSSMMPFLHFSILPSISSSMYFSLFDEGSIVVGELLSLSGFFVHGGVAIGVLAAAVVPTALFQRVINSVGDFTSLNLDAVFVESCPFNGKNTFPFSHLNCKTNKNQ